MSFPMLVAGTADERERYAYMPRFYFHLHNDIECVDEEGVELANLQLARERAIQLVRVTFAETAKDEGRVVLHDRIDIEDGEGTVLDTVHFWGRRESGSIASAFPL